MNKGKWLMYLGPNVLQPLDSWLHRHGRGMPRVCAALDRSLGWEGDDAA